MTSAAEQFASNISLSSFAKADELKKRLLFALGALVVYRLGTFIPIPGVNAEVFAQAFGNQTGGLLGTFNLFAGGAVERMAIFALNIMPYISASIIMQLMTIMSPSLKSLYSEEGELGRAKFTQYVRMLMLPLAILQGFGFLSLLQSQGVLTGLSSFEFATNHSRIFRNLRRACEVVTNFMAHNENTTIRGHQWMAGHTAKHIHRPCDPNKRSRFCICIDLIGAPLSIYF